MLAALEWTTTRVWGDLAYPLPGLDEAAYYLYFQMPERLNPLFVLEAEQTGDEEPTFITRPGVNTEEFYLVREQRFPARRAADGLRIAGLGGSSVQGWPFTEPGTSFIELVGDQLEDRGGIGRVDVINAGVGSYNTFQIVDVAHQVAVFDPDVVVLYAGHNDQGYYLFHKTFLDSVLREQGRGTSTVMRVLNRSNAVQGLRRLRDRGRVSSDPQRHGLTTHSPDDVFMQRESYVDFLGEEKYLEFLELEGEYLARFFERNLRDIVGTLRDKDTKVILVVPGANLRDWPPTLSLHYDSITPTRAEEIDVALQRIRSAMDDAGVGPRPLRPIEQSGNDAHWNAGTWLKPGGSPSLAVGDDRAVAACRGFLHELDALAEEAPRYSMTHFLLGSCLLHSDPESALVALRRARDLAPALPPWQRATSAMLEVVHAVGADLGIPVVDLPSELGARADAGVPGGEFFVDNIHLSPVGAQVVAEIIADAIRDLELKPRRAPDPAASVTQAAVIENARNPRWGMDLHMPGAGDYQGE